MTTTLLIYILIIGGSDSGGASVRTEKLTFESIAQCQTAAKQIATDGVLWRSPMTVGGQYRVVATCIQGGK